MELGPEGDQLSDITPGYPTPPQNPDGTWLASMTSMASGGIESGTNHRFLGINYELQHWKNTGY